MLSSTFEIYFCFNIPLHQLREPRLPAILQNFPNSINSKFIYRWKNPATSSNQEYLFNSRNSFCRQKIIRWQLHKVIRSFLSKIILFLTILLVNSSRFPNSWMISIVLDMVPLLVARVGSGRILAISRLHLISGNSDGHLR